MTDEIPDELQFTTQDPRSEPITFAVDDTVFECHAWMNAKRFQDITKGRTGRTVLQTFGEFMDPEEYERFCKFIGEDSSRVDNSLLNDIQLALLLRYAGAGKDRPTKRPASSGGGPRTTRAGSRGSSRSPDATQDG